MLAWRMLQIDHTSHVRCLVFSAYVVQHNFKTLPFPPSYMMAIRWGKFSQKHNYEYVAKWLCLLAMEKLHVLAYSGHLQVLTTFLLKEFYIICLNRVLTLRSHHHYLRVFVKPSLVGCLLRKWRNRHPTKLSLTKSRKMMRRSQHHHAV
jgi:hypothetical protein